MYVQKGGMLYSFCPGKVTWDREATRLLAMLTTAAHTGAMLGDGGIAEQPGWWIDMLEWFLPLYDRLRVGSYAQMVFGSGKKPPAGGDGQNQADEPQEKPQVAAPRKGGRSIGRRA